MFGGVNGWWVRVLGFSPDADGDLLGVSVRVGG